MASALRLMLVLMSLFTCAAFVVPAYKYLALHARNFVLCMVISKRGAMRASHLLPV